MDSLGLRLRTAHYLFRAALDAELHNLGLTATQYGVLDQVDQHDGNSVPQLARRSFVTPQRMHQIVAGLEKDGLISREPHPDLERVLRTHLTEHGHEVLTRCHKHVRAIENRMLKGMDKTDRKRASDLVDTVVANLQT